MLYGIIHRWNGGKGYGFIKPDRGPDVFFHITAFGECIDPRTICEGHPVQYELEGILEPKKKRIARPNRFGEAPEPTEPEKSPQAKMVELIEKIPGNFLDRPAENLSPAHHPKARRRKPSWRKKSKGDDPVS